MNTVVFYNKKFKDKSKYWLIIGIFIISLLTAIIIFFDSFKPPNVIVRMSDEMHIYFVFIELMAFLRQKNVRTYARYKSLLTCSSPQESSCRKLFEIGDETVVATNTTIQRNVLVCGIFIAPQTTKFSVRMFVDIKKDVIKYPISVGKLVMK